MGDPRSRIWTPPGGSADAPGEEQARPDETAAQGERELSPEELAEYVRRLSVSDVLVSTMATVAQLGYAKLETSSRDLDQARLAIEALRALLPVLEGTVDAAATRDFSQLIANLQLAYATAAGEGGATAG